MLRDWAAKRLRESAHLLEEKLKFLQEIKFLSSLPASHIDSLSKEVFYDRYVITSVIWKQNSLIDAVRFFPIVKHGEVSVIRRYTLETDDVHLTEKKNVLFATLTPGAVFLEEGHVAKNTDDPRGKSTDDPRGGLEVF